MDLARRTGGNSVSDVTIDARPPYRLPGSTLGPFHTLVGGVKSCEHCAAGADGDDDPLAFENQSTVRRELITNTPIWAYGRWKLGAASWKAVKNSVTKCLVGVVSVSSVA